MASSITSPYVISSDAGLSYDEDEIFSVFPKKFSVGITTATVDGSTLFLGGTNGNVICNTKGDLKNIYSSVGQNVYKVLNLENGVNLVAIGNSLLLNANTLVIDDDEQEPTTTTTTTPEDSIQKKVTVVYPNGGEEIYYGEPITIQWTSTEGVNDGVKIDLYDGDEIDRTIVSITSNDGSYVWDIPSDVVGTDYRVRISWLSAGAEAESDYDFSNNPFTITDRIINTTSTTTTAGSNASGPITSGEVSARRLDRFIPILELPNDEYITEMKKDYIKGGILFATNKGRILHCEDATVNAYLSGNRRVYAETTDGFGNVSESRHVDLMYALYNKIIEINSDKEFERFVYAVDPVAIATDRVEGIFLSPIMDAGEEMGFWKNLIWREYKPSGTEIMICFRTADSIPELKTLPWEHCFISRDSDRGYGSTGLITRSLDDYMLGGRYIQFRVTMTTDVRDVSPSLLYLGVTYVTEYAVYFFTTKFSLDRSTDLQRGLLTATITEPQNTEIKFGINNTNSVTWSDYDVVELDKFFEMRNYDNVKVAIKFISYDDSIPVVSEFVLMAGGEELNRVVDL